jgi:hypothetical protein
MDAIQNSIARNPEGLAGSPDAAFAMSRAVSCRLAHSFRVSGFCVFGVTSFREPMKENHDV